MDPVRHASGPDRAQSERLVPQGPFAVNVSRAGAAIHGIAQRTAAADQLAPQPRKP